LGFRVAALNRRELWRAGGRRRQEGGRPVSSSRQLVLGRPRTAGQATGGRWLAKRRGRCSRVASVEQWARSCGRAARVGASLRAVSRSCWSSRRAGGRRQGAWSQGLGACSRDRDGLGKVFFTGLSIGVSREKGLGCPPRRLMAGANSGS
jgi:hypothetical protein